MGRREDLWAEMAAHTKPKCGSPTCSTLSPNRCCSRFYCIAAMGHAESEGVVLAPTDHPELPGMGPDGCTFPPHLRPMCTMHQCHINSIGVLPTDRAWTEKYFELRAEIDEAEFEHHCEQEKA